MCYICSAPSVKLRCDSCTFTIASEKRRLDNLLRATVPGSEKRFDYLTRRLDNNISRFDMEIDSNRHLTCHEIMTWEIIEQISPNIRA